MRYSAVVIAILALPMAASAALVNINTANKALLDTLPGIGPSKAATIVDYRTKHGPFGAIEDIQRVSGIGPVTFANLKGSITVGTEAVGQPPPGGNGYEKVQAVEPITSPKPSLDAHEEAGFAPAAATDLAAAGAPLPPPVSASRAAGLFGSPWAFGLLGVVLLAGGAFIFL